VIELELTILNPTGLHARPAKEFVALAKKFKSSITVFHGEKKANAKSMLSVLALGVHAGRTIRVEVSGEDEEEAARALEEAVRSGLGEGELINRLQGQAAPARPAPPAQITAQAAPAAAGTAEAAAAAAPASPEVASQTAAPAAETAGEGRGIPAAPGVVIGRTFRLMRRSATIERTSKGARQEKELLHRAIDQARGDLQQLVEDMRAARRDEAAIFEAHLELLADPELIEAVEAGLEQGLSAGVAWDQQIAERSAVLAALDDPTLAARAADLRDVGDRVLHALAGTQAYGPVRFPDYPVILLAHDLTPSDTAGLDPSRVLGFCTAAGGPTSHSAIIARALSIPAVVNAGERVLEIPDGTLMIMDGTSGRIQLDPDEAAQQQAREQQRRERERREAAERMAQNPAVTRDGHRVEVAANIGGVEQAALACSIGAEGVGLMRTEFLFLDRATPPSEEEQFAAYKAIAEGMQGRPVIIRTLDIGGDKPLPYIQVPREDNPFLGERGIRLCLNRPELLREQLRAILRAAAYGHLRIMFPMVADITEIRRARKVVEEVRQELGAPEIEVGIMVEVPSAALMADMLAPEVDFFSIGSNDLTQYTLAVDRSHAVLASMTDGLHPAVLRLIKYTVDAAHRHGKWAGICGELGGDPQAVPILVGLGLDELSMGVPSVPLVKMQISQLSLAEAQDLARRALECATAAEVRALAAEFAARLEGQN